MGVTAAALEKLFLVGLLRFSLSRCCYALMLYLPVLVQGYHELCILCALKYFLTKLQSKCILSKLQSDGLACHAPSFTRQRNNDYVSLKPGVVLHG